MTWSYYYYHHYYNHYNHYYYYYCLSRVVHLCSLRSVHHALLAPHPAKVCAVSQLATSPTPLLLYWSTRLRKRRRIERFWLSLSKKKTNRRFQATAAEKISAGAKRNWRFKLKRLCNNGIHLTRHHHIWRKNQKGRQLYSKLYCLSLSTTTAPSRGWGWDLCTVA